MNSTSGPGETAKRVPLTIEAVEQGMRRGLTQQAVADLHGVTRQAVSDYADRHGIDWKRRADHTHRPGSGTPPDCGGCREARRAYTRRKRAQQSCITAGDARDSQSDRRHVSSTDE